MKTYRPCFFVAALAAAPLLAFAQPASPPTTADETVVLSPFVTSSTPTSRYQPPEATSGSRIRVSLLDSTQSVSVVTRDLMDDIGLGKIVDAAKYVSGVTDSTIPNAQDRTTVRGFQSDGATVDGFSYFSFANVDPVTIDRLEVVKGPSAILAPAGVPGGTINVVSKKPLFQDQGSFSAQVGLFSSNRAELDVNRVLDSGKLAVRVVGAMQKADDYYNGTFHESTTAMPMFTYRFGPSTTLTIQAQWYSWWATDYLGLPIDPYVGTNDSAHLISGVSKDLNVYDDDTPRHQKAGHYRLFFTTNFTPDFSMRLAGNFIQSSGYSNQLNTSGANPGARDPLTGLWIAANAAPGASRIYTRGGSVGEQYRTYANLQNDFVYEFKSSPVNATTLAGYALNYNDTRNEYSMNISKPAFNIDQYSPAPYTPTTVGLDQTTVVRSQQVYVSESAALLDQRVILSGGLSRNFFQTHLFNILANLHAQAAPIATLASYGIVVKPLKTVSLYYGYSEQSTPITPSTTSVIPYTLQSSKQHEFGLRGQLLENRLYATLTYFQIKQDNFSVPNPGNLVVPTPFPALPPLFSNRQAHGWEFELNYAVNKSLSIVGNYTDMKNRDPNNVPFRGTAERSGAVWLNYTFDKASALRGFSAGIGLDYLAKRPGDAASGLTSASTASNPIPNQPSFYLPARTLVNANLTYRIDAHWRTQLNIDNLFDKDYLAASINRFSVYPGTPTNVRLTVTYQF